MNTKRFFSFVLLLAMLFSFLPTAAIPANAATNVDLTVWAEEPSRDWVLQRAEDFNKQSSQWKLNVQFEACHVGESADFVLADPEGAADVFAYANDRLGELVDAKALCAITGDALKQVKADNASSMINSVTHTNEKV